MRRAFDEALAEAGGSLPVWLVLLNLKIRRPANQRELAEAVGVREATLTHHLNSMDAEGLITRQRDTTNRRIHVVELTDAGEETFLRLRTAAVAFDQRLRAGITEKEVAGLEDYSTVWSKTWPTTNLANGPDSWRPTLSQPEVARMYPGLRAPKPEGRPVWRVARLWGLTPRSPDTE